MEPPPFVSRTATWGGVIGNPGHRLSPFPFQIKFSVFSVHCMTSLRPPIMAGTTHAGHRSLLFSSVTFGISMRISPGPSVRPISLSFLRRDHDTIYITRFLAEGPNVPACAQLNPSPLTALLRISHSTRLRSRSRLGPWGFQ